MIPLLSDIWDLYLTLVKSGWKQYRRMTGR
jgi:hypothetical protein